MKKISIALFLVSFILFFGCNEETTVEPRVDTLQSENDDAYWASEPSIGFYQPDYGVFRQGSNISMSARAYNLYTPEDLLGDPMPWWAYLEIGSQRIEANGQSVTSIAEDHDFTITLTNAALGVYTLHCYALNYGIIDNNSNQRYQTFYVRPNSPPSAPTISKSYNSSNGIVTISMYNTAGDGMIDGFRLYCSVDGGSWNLVSSSSSHYIEDYLRTTEARDVDSEEGTASFRAVAYDQSYTSSYSNTITYNWGYYNP